MIDISLSGWLYGLRGFDNINGQWCWKRTGRLLIPYFIWTCLKVLIGSSEYILLDSLFIRPLYWFLINLYISIMLVAIAGKFLKRKVYSLLFYFWFIIAYIYFKDNNLVIKNVVMFFPFYFLGFCAAEYKNSSLGQWVHNHLKFSLILYPLAMLFFSYKDYDRYIGIIKSVFHMTGGDSILKAGLLFYNHYVVAVLGICFVWYIVSIIINLRFLQVLCKGLMILGKYSLQIYILHDFFFFTYFDMSLLNSFVSFGLSICLPVLIGWIIHKCSKLDKILFGF